MEKIPIIIDCDPGHDDALMLMLAFGSGSFDVKAVTISAGNQTQDKTFANALKILSVIGADVPVFRGAEKPLLSWLLPMRCTVKPGFTAPHFLRSVNFRKPYPRKMELRAF